VQLPFLVVHAALVWKVILGAFVGLSLLVFLGVRYALVRAANRAAARDVDTGEEGVIRGTLRGGTASTMYVTPALGASTQPSYHAGELVIATAEGDVVLDGELRVAAGAHVAAKRRGVPAGTPTEIATSDLPIATAVLHEVRTGDEVIAKGTLVREAGDQATDYRENATRRVLRGSILIAARTPATKLVRPSLAILALVIGAMAFIGYKALSLCGDSWRDTCHAGADTELSNRNACVMANAMPNQPYALSVLLDQLDRKPIPSEATLEERIALARLVEDCHSSVGRLERLERPELTLVEAKRCGDYEAQQIALLQLGEFDQAAIVPFQMTGYRSEVRGKLLVLAGAWHAAAAYAEQRATDLRSQPAEPDPDRRDRIASSIVAWQCIAALMESYAGANPVSLPRIRELAGGPHGEECLPELAEVGTPEETARILNSHPGLETPWRAIELERQLAGIGMMKNDGIPAMLLQGSESLGMAYPPIIWATRLSPPIPDTGDLEMRFDDATHRLAIAVWMRDFASAHRYADRAIELAHDERAGYDSQYAGLLHPAIDLYTAKTPLDVPKPLVRDDPELDMSLASLWSFMTPRLALRHGDPLGKGYVLTTEMQAALGEAQHGDGAALAKTLLDDPSLHPIDLIAVLPMVKTHREELVRALPFMPASNQIVDYRFPFGTAQYYAERRQMFELAGDAANAKRANDVFERYAAAFNDHRRLVALSLLDF